MKRKTKKLFLIHAWKRVNALFLLKSQTLYRLYYVVKKNVINLCLKKVWENITWSDSKNKHLQNPLPPSWWDERGRIVFSFIHWNQSSSSPPLMWMVWWWVMVGYSNSLVLDDGGLRRSPLAASTARLELRLKTIWQGLFNYVS